MAVGIGLSINNSRAVLEAILGKPSEFKRTPKYNLSKGQKLAHEAGRTVGVLVDLYEVGVILIALVVAQ